MFLTLSRIIHEAAVRRADVHPCVHMRSVFLIRLICIRGAAGRTAVGGTASARLRRIGRFLRILAGSIRSVVSARCRRRYFFSVDDAFVLCHDLVAFFRFFFRFFPADDADMVRTALLSAIDTGDEIDQLIGSCLRKVHLAIIKGHLFHHAVIPGDPLQESTCLVPSLTVHSRMPLTDERSCSFSCMDADSLFCSCKASRKTPPITATMTQQMRTQTTASLRLSENSSCNVSFFYS